MQQALLDHLRKITEEEQRILDGASEVDQGLYTSGKDFTVDSAKMLEEGKLIAVRTHTRFVHFPSHRHNFIEVLYVCAELIRHAYSVAGGNSGVGGVFVHSAYSAGGENYV